MRNAPERNRTTRAENTARCKATWKMELFALSGFCLSGLFFIISGLLNGDYLTVTGSLIWIASCVCWMIPYKRFF